jgi:hypothetical protein
LIIFGGFCELLAFYRSITKILLDSGVQLRILAE